MTRSIDAPTLADRPGDPTGPRPTVIDVRTPVEFEAGRIPGAVNVPLDELRASLDELRPVLDDHHDVVLVRRSGARAGQAHQALGLGIVLAGVLGSTVAPRAKWLSSLVGGGLAFAALTSTCAMGMALARMPWNRRGARPTGSALDRPTRKR